MSAFQPSIPIRAKHSTLHHQVARHTRNLSKSPKALLHSPKITKVTQKQLETLISTNTPGQVLVLKCYASYCRSCKGVEPKYRKIAAAYQGEGEEEESPVRFFEMDYALDEDFCRDQLGVTSLPFFGFWREGRYVGGSPIGWTSIGDKLVRNIDDLVAGVEVPTLSLTPS